MGCKGSSLNLRSGMGNNNSSSGNEGSGNSNSNKAESSSSVKEKSLIKGGRTNERGDEVIFGTGVHVGRAGNVDLSGRKLDFLGTNIVDMINADELHRKATSLTLTNNVLYILGKELSLLPDLEEIDMDSNRFTRLPEALTKLPKLWRINASTNPIDPVRGFDVAPRLTTLTSLTLRDCNFTSFPVRVLEITTLEELDISDNPSIDLHDVSISSLPKIKKLNIANCGLSGKSLPACVRRASGIVSLDISQNQFDFFSGDVSMEFFGKSIPKTLKELHLRGMQLTSVPPFVATLKKLNSLDLAMNPIETLDVLAGRFVKRIPRCSSNGNMGHGYALQSPQSAQSGAAGVGKRDGIPTAAAAAAAADDDAASSVSDGRVSTSSRISISLVSKAGMIAPVSHPIPLKKLSLRACGLRTVPKYFHKMTQIEELDLSENDQLDDPNMTLFSLQNLKVLNIVGCPFAEDPSKSRNEWFDIAKLRKLSDIQWELWKGNHNMSPYRTKIPIEICGLSLRKINQVQLRRDLFVGRTVETVINLLRDGYFKVDLAVDDNTLWSLVEAIHVFGPGESFFFPSDVKINTKGEVAAADAAKTAVGAAKKGGGGGGMLIHGKELGLVHLHIAINRYIFFLAMQAANYDAVIIPPLDVMIMHYSQITCNPAKYRADCEAICGRILNCNYRAFFLEQQRHPQAAKDAVVASKKIWNLMVRSAQTELAWLRYDFWDKRARHAHVDPNGTLPTAPSAAAASVSAPGANAPRLQSLPIGPLGATDSERYADFTELRKVDSTHDLAGVLDQAITSHFMEQGDESFRETLASFFMFNNSFMRHKPQLLKLTLDWTRYVKYLALYAYRVAMSYQSDSTVVMEPIADGEGNLYNPGGPTKRTTSLLGKHYDTMGNVSFVGPGTYLPMPQHASKLNGEEATTSVERKNSGVVRRTSSSMSTASRITQRQKDNARRSTIQNLTTNPIPTIGISLLLHAHRTTHVKYFQTLSLLGIEDVDITWDESDTVIADTMKAWEAVYDEAYIGSSMEYSFHCKDNLISPMQPRDDGGPSSRVFLPEARAASMMSEDGASSYTYTPTLKPKKSSFVKKQKGAERKVDKSVSLCCGDTEYGVF